MKLKHNSIRSGSRIKSSALIVHWQALPARQQTQCYQGTEGRFVCTGRESCCVRPACPEPGEHRDTRMGPRAAEGSSTPKPSLWVPSDGAAASGPSWWISSAAEGQHSGVMLDDENTRVPVSRECSQVPVHPEEWHSHLPCTLPCHTGQAELGVPCSHRTLHHGPHPASRIPL